MLKVDRNNRQFTRLSRPSLADAQLLERSDLQECIYNSSTEFFAEIGERVFVIGKEVTPIQAFPDRIDLLGIDPDGTTVVVELKRGSNKLQMLQAISYAGMVSRWGTEDFRGILSEEQWESLTDFLEVDSEEVNRRQRLLLVAEEYDYALLVGAEWLSEQFGVDVRCAAVALASDPATGSEYLACSSVFPAPALGEQASARARSTQASRPLKWADWGEALAGIENDALREYAHAQIESGREHYLRRRGLHYRLGGKRRWSLSCRRKAAYVWQRGRFENDEEYWRQRLSEPESVRPVKAGTALSFQLLSSGDLKEFHSSATSDLARTSWLVDGADAASDDEDLEAE
jgi:hypothetical protein